MSSTRFRRSWLVVAAALALVATGGLAYAAIPDAGGVIHTCYTKSSGAWRVIDTATGQSCKSNEAALDLYSKGGAELAFLGKTAKAADSDRLDGQDSSAFLDSSGKAADSDKLDGKDSTEFLGATAKAADSDKFDGLFSHRYLKGFDAVQATDLTRLADGVAWDAVGISRPLGAFPGMSLVFRCDADGGTTLVVSAPQPFLWWWDDTFGETPAGSPPYEQTFPIGNGVENHAFRSVLTQAWYTVTLDLDTQIGPSTCNFGWTVHKAANVSPGP